MGANLNRLMQSYGVYTPTVSPYSGVDTPDALKAGATAGERGTYQGSLADYAAQQDAFKGYERDYRNRIATTDLYTNPGPASTFLSTPNYSGIRGMRANLSDTTSADTTDYTNPNFDSMINDAYRSLGRVGIGTDTGNIDQTGYDYWMNQLRTGAIAPRDFKNQFKIATNDYIRQKPDDDYTKYVQGYLGILPAATLPVLSTPGGDTSLGLGGNTGMGGEGPGANPVGYDGDGKETAGDLSNINGGAIGRGIGALLGGAVAGPLGALLGSFGGSRLGGMLSGSAGAAQASSSNLAKAAEDQESDFAAAAALDTSPGNALGGDIAASGPGDFSGAMGDLAAMARGGPVSSPTSMEEALLRDRSRHEFSDPRFEEIYGKYFYADGGPVGGTFIPNPRSALQKVLKYEGLLPGFFGRGPDIVSPGDTPPPSLPPPPSPPPSLPPSFIPDPLSFLQKALKYEGLLPGFFGRGPNIASPSDSSAAERGASLGSSGDVPSSIGNPDDLMSLVYNPGNMPRVTGGGENDRARRRTFLGVTPPMYTGAPRVLDSSSAAESSVGNPDDLMFLEDQRGNLSRDTGTVYPNDPEVAIGQGPAGRVPAPATAPPTYEAQRDDLYRRYLGPQPASPEMLAARQTAREAQANFVKMLNDQSSGETGPSEAEKYFRLASAFLSPTKTGKGAFGESVALASRELADFEKSTTNSKNAAQAAKLQRMLKANEITWQVAKEELASIRAQEEGSRKDTLAIKLEELRDRRDQNDPKTELHRQLIGMGLVRGTDEYKKEYARRTALADEAAALKQAKAQQDLDSLTPIEQRDLLKSEEGFVQFENTLKKLREALDINDQTFATGSYFGKSENFIKTQLGSNDQTAINTARQAILLQLVAVGKLKSTFPGAISDKETAILSKLQGIDSATLEGRKRIISDALLDLEELKIEMMKHINDVRSGRYRTYNRNQGQTANE